MTYAVESDIGATKRQSGGVNEDSAGVVPLTLTVDGTDHTAEIVVVADGAGGHDAGEVASYLAVNRVVERLVEAVTTPTAHDLSSLEGRIDAPFRATPAEVEEAIEAAIEAANEDILSFCAEERTEAHTTVVAGVRIGGRLHYGWVGDSRAYVLNAIRDEIVPLTTDHAVVQRLRDAGEIDDVEALVHPRGNEITRALGGSGQQDPETATVGVETATVPLYREDVLLVTSDGLLDAQTEAAKLYEWYVDAGRDDEMAAVVRDRSVTDDEIRECVLSAPSLEDAAADLVSMANERGGKDNLSTILLHDATLPETPDDPPSRTIGAEPAVEDRETLVGSGN